jgi:hypothetical protein
VSPFVSVHSVQPLDGHPGVKAIYRQTHRLKPAELIMRLDGPLEQYASRLCAELDSAFLTGVVHAQNRVRKAIGL